MTREDRTAAEAVSDQVREALLDGALPPGTWLREETLAERFEVGRYTVRAAFAQLVSAGLLVHERNRGVMVPELTARRVDELYGFRSVVELGALRVALERQADLGEVEAAVRALEQLADESPWHVVSEAHGRIHHAIVATADNPRLLAAYETCEDELRFMIAFVQPDFTPRRLATLHRRLMTHLHQGGETAIRALTFDLEVSGRTALRQALDRLHESAGLKPGRASIR